VTRPRLFRCHRWTGGWWFRILGYGLSVYDRRMNPPLFSERYGYRKVLRLGPYSVRFLTPEGY
jgi:hypothetical protein